MIYIKDDNEDDLALLMINAVQYFVYYVVRKEGENPKKKSGEGEARHAL